MNGYQVTFFTQQSERHAGKPVGEWLVQLAREMALPGATLLAADEGFGHAGRLHSAHFFELTEQPVQVVLALGQEQCDRLFARLEAEGVHLFYVKAPVEFGTVGRRET